jgi:hypothetical protein
MIGREGSAGDGDGCLGPLLTTFLEQAGHTFWDGGSWLGQISSSGRHACAVTRRRAGHLSLRGSSRRREPHVPP